MERYILFLKLIITMASQIALFNSIEENSYVYDLNLESINLYLQKDNKGLEFIDNNPIY